MVQPIFRRLCYGMLQIVNDLRCFSSIYFIVCHFLGTKASEESARTVLRPRVQRFSHVQNSASFRIPTWETRSVPLGVPRVTCEWGVWLEKPSPCTRPFERAGLLLGLEHLPPRRYSRLLACLLAVPMGLTMFVLLHGCV